MRIQDGSGGTRGGWYSGGCAVDNVSRIRDGRGAGTRSRRRDNGSGIR